MNLELMKQVKEWEEDGFTPDYFIKCDDMYGSLMEIPELKEKAEELGDELFFTINTDHFKFFRFKYFYIICINSFITFITYYYAHFSSHNSICLMQYSRASIQPL